MRASRDPRIWWAVLLACLVGCAHRESARDAYLRGYIDGSDNQREISKSVDRACAAREERIISKCEKAADRCLAAPHAGLDHEAIQQAIEDAARKTNEQTRHLDPQVTEEEIRAWMVDP